MDFGGLIRALRSKGHPNVDEYIPWEYPYNTIFSNILG
jgi:hypothetical protein